MNGRAMLVVGGRLMVLAPLLLGACATPPPVIEPVPVFIDTPAPVIPEPEPEPIPDPVADPERLIGLNPADLRDIFGPATLVRRDAGAQFVQFSSETCIFDVYFYEPASGEGFRARHLAARDLSGASLAPADCLESLLPGGYWPADVDARLGLSPTVAPAAPVARENTDPDTNPGGAPPPSN